MRGMRSRNNDERWMEVPVMRSGQCGLGFALCVRSDPANAATGLDDGHHANVPLRSFQH